jgi:hypothetical protein
VERDLRASPGMVRWFNPPLLMKTARQAVASALFGQYADRRLLHAALDTVTPLQMSKDSDLTNAVQPDANGAIWVDFVADLGDGFDSTYAIAYLLSRPDLKVDGTTLPRGQVLVMGGDQVYPTAGRDEYSQRLKRPYEWAFPRSKQPGAIHPLLYLIPGNHDWYDGLTLFLAMFCRGRSTPLGSWHAMQHRSYFAIQLANNWWFWGADTQLSEDIDAPQAAYFVDIARSMKPNAKIILCSGVPTWIKAADSGKDEFYRGLEYVANIAKSEAKGATICAVLSGDTHHYSRYSGKQTGTQFITAGGGGAFLHPTHSLVDVIPATWVGKYEDLLLKTEPSADHPAAAKPACYPIMSASRRLLFGNLKFPLTNPEFCLTLGGFYWVMHLLLTMWRDDVLSPAAATAVDGGDTAQFWSWAGQIFCSVTLSPMMIFAVFLFAWVFWTYADAKTKAVKGFMAAVHAAAHLLVLLGLIGLLPPLNAVLFGIHPGQLRTWFATLIEFGLGGFIGGVIWGVYLFAACYWGKRHCNDAFSAMRLNSYRHFLRMRLTQDKLEIYPIGLDTSPRREDWMVNPAAEPDNQDIPVIVPKSALQPQLIEGPIVIDVAQVKPLSQVV